MLPYELESTGGDCLVKICRSLTAVLVPELQQVLQGEVEKGTQHVTFDLAKAQMLDSSGIGLLIAASNTLSRKNGRVSVINPSREIFGLLRSMRLISRLHVSAGPDGEPDYE